MKQINFELILLSGRTPKPLNFLAPSKELSPGRATGSYICALSRLRVSLCLLEAKGVSGAEGDDTGQLLGVLRTSSFVQNIQRK